MYILAMALVATVLAAPIRVTAMATKALAGPPSEFARMALPDPVLAGITSNAATTHVSLMTSGTGCAYTHSFSVDSTVGFNMALFSPVGGLTLTLVDPNGYNIDLRKISSPVKKLFFVIAQSQESIMDSSLLFARSGFVSFWGQRHRRRSWNFLCRRPLCGWQVPFDNQFTKR